MDGQKRWDAEPERRARQNRRAEDAEEANERMMKTSHRRAAHLLADAWRAGDTLEFPRDLLPENRAAAYSIQDEMARSLIVRGENAVAGWKVGATSRAVQRAEGYDGPIPGRIFASTIYESGAHLPASRFPYAKVEAEIAFRFVSAPRPASGRFSMESLVDCIEMLPAFDITSTRYAPRRRRDWDSQQNMLAGIADNGNGGAVVLGRPEADWRRLDFMGLAVDLRVNDGPSAPNLWNEARGHPLEALRWTVVHVYRRGFTLSAGDVALTGSLSQPQPLRAGDRVVCRFADAGCVTCQISRA